MAPIEAKSAPEINIDVKLLILNNGMDYWQGNPRITQTQQLKVVLKKGHS